jgi:HD superfamily phosphohydrolase YqeK
LYIADKVDWERRYPVIKLDWSSLSHRSAQEMEEGIRVYQERIADKYGITLKQKYASNRMQELL